MIHINLVHVLTRRLAIANPMVPKSFYLSLATASLWLTGLHKVASAQVTTTTDIPLTPSVEAVTTPATSIQPATSDTTVIQQDNQFDILGGQSSGGAAPNLIHQFEQFDVGTADQANFIVAPDVANVVSLIDSAQPSSIDGLLKITSSNPNIDSNANLYLVNPAGIIFGENVRLNIPANLTATTAFSLLFDESYLLSVDGSVSEISLSANRTSSQSANVLTISDPTVSDLTGDPTGYLFVGDSISSTSQEALTTELPEGSIENQGTLEVSPQASITFVGRYVQNDGDLIAPGGNINLVAISEENLLRLSQTGSLLSLDLVPTSDISFLSPSSLPQLLTGGEEYGATEITTNPDGTQSLSDTPAAGSVLVRGSINVSNQTVGQESGNTAGAVTIVGNYQVNLVGAEVNADGVSEGGSVTVGGMPIVDDLNAAYTLIDRNSTISTDAEGGIAGDISIWATDTVRFYGEASAAGSELDGTVTIEAGETVDER